MPCAGCACKLALCQYYDLYVLPIAFGFLTWLFFSDADGEEGEEEEDDEDDDSEDDEDGPGLAAIYNDHIDDEDDGDFEETGEEEDDDGEEEEEDEEGERFGVMSPRFCPTMRVPHFDGPCCDHSRLMVFKAFIRIRATVPPDDPTSTL